MAYPHKWSPISYKSSAGQRKHIGQRAMLYRWTTPPTQGEEKGRQSPSPRLLATMMLLRMTSSVLWRHSDGSLTYSGDDGVAADDVMNRATSQRAYAV